MELGVELVDELVDGDGELIESAVEGSAAAVLGAGGIGDLPGDRPVGQVAVSWEASATKASGIVAAVSTRLPPGVLLIVYMGTSLSCACGRSS